MSKTTNDTLQIGILAFDQMELLDFAGPYEVFTTASRVCEKFGSPKRFAVQTVAQQRRMVQARAGLGIMPDVGFLDTCFIDERETLTYDVLIVPGGVVTDALRQTALLDWLRAMHRTTRYTASICTGAFLLAQAGVLRQTATTHWEDMADLRAAYPQLTVRDDVRWVQDGMDERVYSSAGISAGIDLSLHLVAQLLSAEWADKTARQMDYLGDWQSNKEK